MKTPFRHPTKLWLTCFLLFTIASVLRPVNSRASQSPGTTAADTLYNQHSSELSNLIFEYNKLSMGMSDVPQVRAEVEGLISMASDALSEGTNRVSVAKNEYLTHAQAAQETTSAKITELESMVNDYMSQTPRDTFRIREILDEIETVREEYDREIEQLLAQYITGVYAASNVLADAIKGMNGSFYHLQAAASLIRITQTALDTYVAYWLGLTSEQQTSPEGQAFKQAMDNAQKVFSADYAGLEAYEQISGTLQETYNNLQLVVTTVNKVETSAREICVRTLSGQLVYRHIAPEQARCRLPRGIYLFDRAKVYIP